MKKHILWMKFVPSGVIVLAQLVVMVGSLADSKVSARSPQEATKQPNSKQPTEQQKSPAMAAQPKPPVTPTPTAKPNLSAGQVAAQPPPTFIREIVYLDVANSSSYLPPDANQIIELLGTTEFRSNYIYNYHKAIMRCFAGGGFFASENQNTSTECGSLQFSALPRDGH